MKVEFYNDTNLAKTINDVLLSTGNEKKFKIITKEKEYLFTIENHKIVDEENNVFDKMVEINERSF